MRKAQDNSLAVPPPAASPWKGAKRGARLTRKFAAGAARGWHVFAAETRQRPGESRREYGRRMRYFFGPMTMPFLFYGLIGAGLWAAQGEEGLADFSVLLAGDWLYFLPGAGKAVAIPLMVGGGAHPALVAISCIFLDTLVAFFVAFNFDYAQRFPILDRFIRVFTRGCEQLLRRYPWLVKFSFLGLVVFLLAPFEGTGGIGGTLIGMAVGLGRLRTWLAILIGSSITSFALAYGSEAATGFLSQLRYGGYISLALFLGIFVYSFYVERRAARALRE